MTSCLYCGKPVDPIRQLIHVYQNGKVAHENCHQDEQEARREINRQMIEQQGDDPNDADTWEGDETFI